MGVWFYWLEQSRSLLALSYAHGSWCRPTWSLMVLGQVSCQEYLPPMMPLQWCLAIWCQPDRDAGRVNPPREWVDGIVQN